MLTSFARYVAELDDGARASLPPEDMALCAVWRAAYKENAEHAALVDAALAAVNGWVSAHESMTPDSEGLRVQPVLRSLIDDLGACDPAQLTRDEADFLCWCDALMARVAKPERFETPRRLLAPYLDALKERRAQRDPGDPFPGLSARVAIYLEDELTKVPRREVKRFGGIEVVFRGRVAAFKGAVKVYGDVPENCAVVAEGGSVCVRGHVLGMVAATRSCDITGNLAGVVVANQGDVRMRNLLRQAQVVSKQGDVVARRAEAPKLVYGNNDVRLRQHVRGGTYHGLRVHIEDEIEGGTVHFAELLQGGRLQPGNGEPLSIVFRRNLSCEDYGEALSEEARLLLRRARRMRLQVIEAAQLMQLTEREADHYAQNALYYLVGGKEATEDLERLESAQRRIGFLERVVAGLDELIEVVRERIEAAERRREAAKSTAGAGTAEPEELQSLLLEELQSIKGDDAIDAELLQGREELLRAHREWSRSRRDASLAGGMLKRLLEQRARWISQNVTLSENVEIMQQGINSRLGRVALLERIQQGAKPSQVLQQLLTALKARKATEAERRTLAQPFMQLCLRQMQARLVRVREHGQRAERLRQEYRELCRLLRDTHHVVSGEVGDEANLPRPRATAIFTADVRLFADPLLMGEDRLEGEGVWITPPNLDATHTYERTPNSTIVRVG